jgi:murein DD-endopeptidase MepM/ murein hydrolase activator NlpD
VAGFLVIPAYYTLAQVSDANTNSNTNTDNPANTNSDQSYSLDNLGLQELNNQLEIKRTALEELKKKADLYEQNIKSKQQEAVTLQNQMALIDLQVQQTENDIETIKQETENLNLEISKLDISISEKTQELDYNKEVLSEYLRLIYKYDQKSLLEIMMTKATFSEFFDDLQYAQDLQDNVQDSVVLIKSAKQELETNKLDKENKKTELTDLSEKLTSSLSTLDSQKTYKTVLLDETRDSQEKFEELLEVARQETAAAQADIGSLESKAREQLEEKGIDLNVEATLMWPVSPTKGISAYFHDPTYIFRKLFEHPAIDIRAGQGTAVRAADNGYVVRAKNAGLGYSYVMIVHNNELSTVYGHMSRIDVDEDSYVVRGQQIGLSGGTPGTPGAGGLTTGPHLHFEVRSGGIPVNPLDYLPSL